jgi:hypothetical protein
MRLFALFNALVASVMVPVVASPIVNITATDDPQIAITHDSNHVRLPALLFAVSI